MSNILINYADRGFFKAQKLNSESGLEHGFDRVINYCRKDIDSDFLNKNEYILNKVRGAGYWLWKPYIILKTLKSSDIVENDIIFYSDSGSEFISSVFPLLDLVNYEDIVLFFDGRDVGLDTCSLSKTWTKRDTFVFMDIDTEEYHNTRTMLAGFQIYKKSEKSISFLERYLELCCNPAIITDDANIYNKPNFVEFDEHRHDQSILCLFAKKENVKLHKDPSGYGIGSIGLEHDNYGQIIDHNRAFNIPGDRPD